jgi:hypothetical protein
MIKYLSSRVRVLGIGTPCRGLQMGPRLDSAVFTEQRHPQP